MKIDSFWHVDVQRQHRWGFTDHSAQEIPARLITVPLFVVQYSSADTPARIETKFAHYVVALDNWPGVKTIPETAWPWTRVIFRRKFELVVAESHPGDIFT